MDLDLPGGEAVFYEKFFPPEESRDLFLKLKEETSWRQEEIRIYGRLVPLPRLTAWYGDPWARYVYSGISQAPLPWTDCLLSIKKKVEAKAGAAFNGVLLNLYRSGSDGVAWHADDEPELGAEPVIASVSFGAPRIFQLKHKFSKELKRVELNLTGGSLLVMRGQTQKNWLHQVPKTKKPVQPRINLTFRAVL